MLRLVKTRPLIEVEGKGSVVVAVIGFDKVSTLDGLYRFPALFEAEGFCKGFRVAMSVFGPGRGDVLTLTDPEFPHVYPALHSEAARALAEWEEFER